MIYLENMMKIKDSETVQMFIKIKITITIKINKDLVKEINYIQVKNLY